MAFSFKVRIKQLFGGFVLWNTFFDSFWNILALKSRAETNFRNVANEPFSKRTNIRIFVRFYD